MNSEELKKKILNEINKHQLFGGRFGNRGELLKFPNELLANLLSELLIAAGIGDVKEVEHRAEVAEKALKHAVNVYIAHTETSSKKKWWYKYFLREAEKELAEERKDEN